MLTKNDIAQQVESETGIKPNLVKRVLDVLGDIAEDELSQGNDFTIPGLVRINWQYRKPAKKGERWKKGDTRVNNITKEETIADADSPEIKPTVKLKANIQGKAKKVVPSSRDRAAQSRFLKSKAGKAVAARKG
jgi:nucleoid DNA-binding protein